MSEEKSKYTFWKDCGKKEAQWIQISCSVCGETFEASQARMLAKMRNGSPIYCPHGHIANGDGPHKFLAEMEATLSEVEKERDSLKRSLVTTKGNYTKLKKKLEDIETRLP